MANRLRLLHFIYVHGSLYRLMHDAKDILKQTQVRKETGVGNMVVTDDCCSDLMHLLFIKHVLPFNKCALLTDCINSYSGT